MEALDPTWYTAVPTMHQAVLARASGNRDVIARHRLSFIRSCSAPMQQRVLLELEEAFGTRVVESYGMTEAAHSISSNPLAPLPRKLGSVGMASGPDLAIMDVRGNLLPFGEVGEVVELFKNFRLIVNSFYGPGGGRYIGGLGPNLVVKPNGSLLPCIQARESPVLNGSSHPGFCLTVITAVPIFSEISDCSPQMLHRRPSVTDLPS